MKNVIKRLGLIAFAAVIGLTMVSCGGGDGGDNENGNGNGNGNGGTLTVTGIPSEYNGKYAVYASNDQPYLVGAQNINANTGEVTAVQIGNGSVSLPVWVFDNNKYTRFSGDRTVASGNNKNGFTIYNTATIVSGGYVTSVYGKYLQSITFTNGNATVSWDNSSSGGTDNTNPKSITITGLTGKSGTVDIILGDLVNNNDVLVARGGGTISSNSVTVSLKKQDSSDWTGSGSYIIQLRFADGEFWFYTGGQTWAQLGITSNMSEGQVFARLPRCNITETTSTISFSQFQNQETL